ARGTAAQEGQEGSRARGRRSEDRGAAEEVRLISHGERKGSREGRGQGERPRGQARPLRSEGQPAHPQEEGVPQVRARRVPRRAQGPRLVRELRLYRIQGQGGVSVRHPLFVSDTRETQDTRVRSSYPVYPVYH